MSDELSKSDSSELRIRDGREDRNESQPRVTNRYHYLPIHEDCQVADPSEIERLQRGDVVGNE